jgi:hypothetical protein
MTVDDFVVSKVLPEFRPVVAAIRKVMKESAPGVSEVISYGIPMYGLKRPVAWINPSNTGITFGFRQGASFADKYHLLRGTGKHARHLRMKNSGEVNAVALRYYIKQALKLDKSST